MRYHKHEDEDDRRERKMLRAQEKHEQEKALREESNSERLLRSQTEDEMIDTRYQKK